MVTRIVAPVAAAAGFLAYLVSLFLGWAAVEGPDPGYFALTGSSSGLTAILGVGYLAATLVALGLSGSALFTPPPRHRWYAGGAVLAAVADLGAVAGLWYRIGRPDGIEPGPGVYAAGIAVLAVVVVAAVSGAGYRRGREGYGG